MEISLSHTQRAIDLLTYSELLEVRDAIDAEIRRRKASQQVATFKAGDQVTFLHESTTYFATVIRVNPKTITVVTQSPRAGTWRISPSFLTQIRQANTI